MTIEKVKTFNGMKYAIKAPFKSSTKDKDGNIVVTVANLVVEYKSGDNIFPAIFPVTSEGLAKAKEIMKALKK